MKMRHRKCSKQTAFPQLCSTITILTAYINSENPVCDSFCYFTSCFLWKGLQKNIPRETVETDHYPGQFYIKHFNINKNPWTTKPNRYSQHKERWAQETTDLFSCQNKIPESRINARNLSHVTLPKSANTYRCTHNMTQDIHKHL